MLHFLSQEDRDTLGSPVVGNLHEHGESTGTLVQGGDLRLATFADDQIALPETWNRTILGLDRKFTNVDHIPDLSPGHGRL